MLDPLKLADALDAEGELHLPEGGGKISAEAFAAIVRALRELGAKPDDPADGGVKDDLDVGRIAFHALRALRPGDVVPAGVVTERPRRGGPHPSHSLRSSDASTFDVICTACGHTDVTPGSWGALVDPCPAPPEEGMPA